MKRLAALLLTGAILVAGCGGAAKPAAEAPKAGETKTVALTLATMSPLSGSNASLGESIRYGAELALKDRAADLEKAGLKVGFLAVDDQAKPEQGTQLAEQLLTKKEVVAVVGALNSGVTIPVSQKFTADNLVMVSPAATAIQVTDRKLPNMNRIVARDDNQGPAAAKFIKDDLKAASIFIIHDKTPYGQGLAEEVKKAAATLGLKVDGFEGINTGDKDFTAVITKVKGAGSPAIYYGGVYPEAAQLVKQMKEKALTAKLVGADGLDSNDFIKLAGDAAVGTFYTSTVGDVSATAEGKAFAQRFLEFAKKPMDGYGAYGYDSAQVIINALIDWAKANPGKTPTRKDVSDAVRKTSGFKGVASTVTFDEKGDNKEAKVFIYSYKEAKYPGSVVK